MTTPVNGMYYVYELSFGNNRYIGCTNNIRRRKDQHNGNARRGSSKLGRFLSDNRIILNVNDFIILFKTEMRSEALDVERRTAKERETIGYSLLNDNFSVDCTRKGKRSDWCAKSYIVVDYREHTVTEISNLKQYSLKVGVDYRLLHRTIRHRSVCGDRFIVFNADDWVNIPDKEKYVSGDYVKERDLDNLNKLVQRSCKKYEVMCPDGKVEIVMNLDKFAREHNLTSGTLHATLIKNKPTKGYKVIKRI